MIGVEGGGVSEPTAGGQRWMNAYAHPAWSWDVWHIQAIAVLFWPKRTQPCAEAFEATALHCAWWTGPWSVV